MSALDLRKVIVVVEETYREGGREVSGNFGKAAALAVISNPFAGEYVDDLSPLIDVGAELGTLLGERALGALGAPVVDIQSYGKAAIVGVNGDLEHCAAILHPRLGKPFRAVLGGGEAIIPSSIKRGAAGTAIDIPLHAKDDAWRFANFDAMEVRVVDAPGPNEIVVALAISNCGRPHERVGDKRDV